MSMYILPFFEHEIVFLKTFESLNNMGLNDDTSKIFGNNRNVDPQGHGCHRFRICRMRNFGKDLSPCGEVYKKVW